MDPWVVIVGIGVIVGIVAGLVQVVDYIQKRREKRKQVSQPAAQDKPIATPSIPSNLPPRGEFIGREKEKARVREALTSRSWLTCIDGIGGIGKTALALEVARESLHASRGEIPGDGIPTFAGFIWSTARDRELTLNDLLDAVARTLDYPGIAQQPLEEKRRSVRGLLQAKPYLLIVDNFETVTDDTVRDFLLDLPEPTKCLVTSRQQKLRQACAISLKGLHQDEALTLIRSEGRRLGLAALEQAEDQVLLRLYKATGGAPLAIKWSVGQIKQKGQSLDAVLAALHEARGNIFEDMFTLSWFLLTDEARQILMVMPFFATSAAKPAIEAASDVHHFALDEGLGQLVEMSLVDVSDELDETRRRYSIHPLTRAFARAKFDGQAEVRDSAEMRLAEFYQSFVQSHGGMWNREGFAQLAPELANILNTIRRCGQQQRSRTGIDILQRIADFMGIRGYWNDLMALGEQAVGLADALGDDVRRARIRVGVLGWIHRHRGDLDAAEEHIEWGLKVLEQADDQWYAAYAKRSLGRIAQERGDFDRANRLLHEALAFYESVNDARHIAFATANLADVALQQGDLDVAQTLCENILPLARKIDDPERIAHLLQVLGGVADQRGNLRKARAFWQEALAHFERVERPDEIADVLFELAQIDSKLGNKDSARQMLSRALETYRRLDMRAKVQTTEELLATLA